MDLMYLHALTHACIKQGSSEYEESVMLRRYLDGHVETRILESKHAHTLAAFYKNYHPANKDMHSCTALTDKEGSKQHGLDEVCNAMNNGTSQQNNLQEVVLSTQAVQHCGVVKSSLPACQQANDFS